MHVMDLSVSFSTAVGAAMGATIGYVANPDLVAVGAVAGATVGIAAKFAITFGYSYMMLPDSFPAPNNEN